MMRKCLLNYKKDFPSNTFSIRCKNYVMEDIRLQKMHYIKYINSASVIINLEHRA